MKDTFCNYVEKLRIKSLHYFLPLIRCSDEMDDFTLWWFCGNLEGTQAFVAGAAFTIFHRRYNWLIIGGSAVIGLCPVFPIHHLNHQSTLRNSQRWRNFSKSRSFFSPLTLLPPPPSGIVPSASSHRAREQIQFPALIPEENTSCLFVTSIKISCLYSLLNL